MGERWGKQVELFYSTYVNKVDRKGRVSVPATFRSTLATNRQPNLLIAFPSIRALAVECTGSDRMEEMQDRIESLEQFSEEYENLTQIFADAHPLVLLAADLVLEQRGGEGFVRAFVERLLGVGELTNEEMDELISNC